MWPLRSANCYIRVTLLYFTLQAVIFFTQNDDCRISFKRARAERCSSSRYRGGSIVAAAVACLAVVLMMMMKTETVRDAAATMNQLINIAC